MAEWRPVNLSNPIQLAKCQSCPETLASFLLTHIHQNVFQNTSERLEREKWSNQKKGKLGSWRERV